MIPESIQIEYIEKFKSIMKFDTFIDGDSCKTFEELYSKYLGAENVIGVGNGYDAIKISLKAMNIGKGMRVAVPAHTFIATFFAVLNVGAIPVPIEVDENGQIDLDLLEQIPNLDCVIPVHMHGSSCDMRRLATWAKNMGIFVLEDCAQAAGLDIQGKKAGTWGDMGAFSLYPTKNLFALGDGGVISTNNFKLAARARSISRFGASEESKYVHEIVGENSRLDSIQAGFASINLRYLDEWNDSRRKVAAQYIQGLSESNFTFINRPDSIYHHFVIFSSQRKELQTFLSKRGIATELHYPHLAALEALGEQRANFPNALKFCNLGLSLPISPWQSEENTAEVIKTILEFRLESGE